MSRPLIALLAALLAHAALAQTPLVRVLLEQSHEPVVVAITGAHEGYLADRLVFSTPLPLDWPVAAVAGRLSVEGALLDGEFTLVPRSGVFEWRGRTYRGGLRLVADGDELLIVNVLDIEEYLRGVVPSEMMADWPLEALKAQAIASRSYTLSSLDPGQPFDVCATITCQVYGGVSAEDPRTDLAVAETAGRVITFGGVVARAHYHSDSGGSTASSDEVWGENLPYLTGRDDVSAWSPHRSWSVRLDPEALGRLLASHGHQVGAVHSLSIDAYTRSGRASKATFTGTGGRVTLSGSPLTSVLREAGLKSTRVRVTGPLMVSGDGWGHGVGMSQYGARQLALAGYRFDQILGFYYQGVALSSLEMLAGAKQ